MTNTQIHNILITVVLALTILGQALHSHRIRKLENRLDPKRLIRRAVSSIVEEAVTKDVDLTKYGFDVSDDKPGIKVIKGDSHAVAQLAAYLDNKPEPACGHDCDGTKTSCGTDCE